MALANRIKTLMRLQGDLNTNELAKRTGIQQSTLHRIISGETRSPRQNVVRKLADFFAVNEKQLLGEKSLAGYVSKTMKEALHLHAVPVLAWDDLNHSKAPVLESDKYLLVRRQTEYPLFAAVLHNDDYEPLFSRDMLLLFEKRAQARHLDFVLIRHENKLRLCHLLLMQDGAYINLAQDESEMQLHKIDKPEQDILGVLFEARKEFDPQV